MERFVPHEKPKEDGDKKDDIENMSHDFGTELNELKSMVGITENTERTQDISPSRIAEMIEQGQFETELESYLTTVRGEYANYA